jgi:hypothetical protein
MGYDIDTEFKTRCQHELCEAPRATHSGRSIATRTSVNCIETRTVVYVLTGEQNLGNEFWVVGVYGNRKAAVEALKEEIKSAKAEGEQVYGHEEDDDDEADWDVDFNIEECVVNGTVKKARKARKAKMLGQGRA